MKFTDRVRFLFSNSTLTVPEEWLIGALGGRKSKSGIFVNQKNAMKVTAAYACVNVISATIACMPLCVYETDKNGGRMKCRDHPVSRLLSVEWNEWLTAFRGWRIVMVNALLTSAGYIEIVRKSGRPVALYPMPTKFVTKRINKRTLEPEYIVTVEGENRTIKGNNMIEIPGLAADGYTAFEPIELLREALGLSLAAEEYGAEYYSEGTHPNGVITYPGGFRKANDETFRKEIREGYTGLGKKQRLMILEEGLKFERIAVQPAEGQMIESRKFQVTEIARFFNVPPHKIMDLERATWNNIEEMNISYVADTILPWARNIEQAVMQALLSFTEDKDAGRYAEFDMNMLLRGRLGDRYAAYQKGVMYGWLSPNEVRAKENMSAVPGGDKHYIPQNMMEIGKEDETN